MTRCRKAAIDLDLRSDHAHFCIGQDRGDPPRGNTVSPRGAWMCQPGKTSDTRKSYSQHLMEGIGPDLWITRAVECSFHRSRRARSTPPVLTASNRQNTARGTGQPHRLSHMWTCRRANQQVRQSWKLKRSPNSNTDPRTLKTATNSHRSIWTCRSGKTYSSASPLSALASIGAKLGGAISSARIGMFVATDPGAETRESQSCAKYVDEAWKGRDNSRPFAGSIPRPNSFFTKDMNQALSKADFVSGERTGASDFKIKLFC